MKDSSQLRNLNGIADRIFRKHEAMLLRQLGEISHAKRMPRRTFEVHIKSRWPGEKDLRRTSTPRSGSLVQFLRRAVRDYKRINKRSDVQAFVSVSVKVGTGKSAQLIPMPYESVREFFA